MASASSGVLFDVDGTLVDTTYLHTVCWADAFAGAGHVVTMSDIHHAIGMGSSELLDHLLGKDRDTDADDEIAAGRLALYRQYWGRLQCLPGAAELLRACAGAGLQVVLASSASAAELAALRGVLDCDDAISEATGSADADGGKPDPSILQAALEASGLRPQDAVFVGDAVWDAIAADRAGVTFVGLTCGGTPEVQLREAGAVEVYRDPADLLEHMSQSVIGKLR